MCERAQDRRTRPPAAPPGSISTQRRRRQAGTCRGFTLFLFRAGSSDAFRAGRRRGEMAISLERVLEYPAKIWSKQARRWDKERHRSRRDGEVHDVRDGVTKTARRGSLGRERVADYVCDAAEHSRAAPLALWVERTELEGHKKLSRCAVDAGWPVARLEGAEEAGGGLVGGTSGKLVGGGSMWREMVAGCEMGKGAHGLLYNAQPIPQPLPFKSSAYANKHRTDHHNDSALRIFNKRFTNSSSRQPSNKPTSPLAPSAPTPPTPKSKHVPFSSLVNRTPTPPARPQTPPRSTSPSSAIEDLLAPGDIVGDGIPLQGQLVRTARIQSPTLEDFSISSEFEVVRRLGSGSYAVVYLVREVLSRPPVSEDGHLGPIDLDIPPQRTVYGREFALKCLGKANLDDEALDAQLSEVTIHQSLRSHPNIVTLHRTFETSAFLLLLLEFVPGEDLFYFLEQSRDHEDEAFDDGTGMGSPSRTPPTPSLLASLHPSQLLGTTRLRLVASMFGQMCDAVQACHEQGVYHRDIKPENFIVTDSLSVSGSSKERRVIVKLSDFGLATTDTESSDMDCGSAPYMSFECRNNVAPTYRTAEADVWSLGIVLINMLYHYNPWTDTAEGACSSFSLFRAHGATFFMQRFTGMTGVVADFLATRVFRMRPYISNPLTAGEFGTWIKDLPSLLSSNPPSPLMSPAVFRGHTRTISTSSAAHTVGHIINSCPPSSRPSSRTGMRTPIIGQRSLSRAPSMGPGSMGPVLREEPELEAPDENDGEADGEGDDGRSRSTKKRGKRGARNKSKASTVLSPTSPTFSTVNGGVDHTLETLASASQTLAREISRQSRPSAPASRSSSIVRPIPISAVSEPPPPVPVSVPVQTHAPEPVKKPSKWKLGFGSKGSNSHEEHAPPSPTSGMSSNVATLLMGLEPAPAQHSHHSSSRSQHSASSDGGRSTGREWRAQNASQEDLAHRGRKQHAPRPNGAGANWSKEGNGALGFAGSPDSSSRRSPERPLHPHPQPTPAQKATWRSSQASSASVATYSTTSTSSSAFTRYSNSSMRSVNTMATATTATSVSSAGSWRQKPAAPPPVGPNGQPIPKNVKSESRTDPRPSWLVLTESAVMTGVPWELYELPRQLHPNPEGAVFGSPPQPRKVRTRKSNLANEISGKGTLDTISERPVPAGYAHVRRDAATSTTDLSDGEDDGPKKVQRGQINALAKMLSALRRCSEPVIHIVAVVI
ncbi:Pkinase-domain-containing protein [Coniophora puteana RWD-64-598 SS2]|uniref:Pkinase-domain-containing protein n=1 Tax=Coniophora puteana (strain RWD-64-598) TaxID=741705 RepID=A0A5M3MX50_CONPW|nr:Pkinase-domain-containing protein [Coniophora puteana RWD-64-598 SS2]EIW83295.1 Pkinase-domain-containing protein [Coniophora puteana RWD-64-598 SS2]